MTNEPLTAPKKNGGGSTNINIELLINIGGYRQLSVPKPPILLAATVISIFKNKKWNTKIEL